MPSAVPFHRLHLTTSGVALLLGLISLLGLFGPARAENSAAAFPTLVIETAHLLSAAGERPVHLPNVLERRDFDPEGSTVRYRMTIDLPAVPDSPLGVFVSKMSLSGKLHLNGKAVGSCEPGPLALSRCLHRPYLFVPPDSIWRVGENILEFEIFASSRQMNGLSAVRVGDADVLDRTIYSVRTFLQVELTRGLTWACLTLGIVLLSASLLLRREPAFFWFGLSSLTNALANLNILLERVVISSDFYSWLVFSSRLSFVCFFYLAILSLFDREKTPDWLRRLLVGGSLLGPLIVAATHNDRNVVAALYVPLLLALPALLAAITRWTWQSRRPLHLAVTLMTALAVLVSPGDWLRLAGLASFEGVYLISYVYSGMLLVAGAILVNSLASSIMAARELQRTLEQNVESRTAQLASALQSIKDMERTALKLTENIPVGTYVVETDINRALHITFVSDRLLKILGASRQSILADTKVLFRSIYADDYPDFVASMNAALADGKPHRWTGRGFVNGEVRWLSLEANPRFLDDGTVLWEGVVTDITDLKAAEAALQKANDDLLAIEIERTRLEEREIILRDMHDGFGSQLASLRFLLAERTIDREHLTVALNECIADLYLVIDTLGAKENTLRDAVADFRFRTARRLAELPLAIHWTIDLDKIPAQTQQTQLQILRIVQETINNVLQHAQAKTIWFDAIYRPESGQLVVRVADDGLGIAQPVRRGRGLTNMERRAADLGAEIVWRERFPGTELVLTMTIAA